MSTLFKRSVSFIALMSFATSLLAADDTPRDRLNESVAGPQTQEAVASDRLSDAAQEEAMELLRRRGSVLDGRDQFQKFNRPTDPNWPQSQPYGYTEDKQPPLRFQQLRHLTPEQPSSKVVSLREAAWQLETTAHRLENIDLYEQADALREVANRLRRDARKMKQHIAPELPLSPTAPAQGPR